MQADESRRNDPEVRAKHRLLILEQAKQLEIALPHLKAICDLTTFSHPINRLLNQLQSKINTSTVEEMYKLAENPTYIGNCAAFDRQLSLEEDE